MTFQNTDKILVNRGGVDYQAEIGPLMGGGSGGGGVTSIIAGSGISVDQTTGDVTITATGGGGGGDQCLYTCDSYIPNLPTFN